MRCVACLSALLLAWLPGGSAEVKTIAEAGNPYGLVIGPDGALYYCEVDANRVSRLDIKTSARSTVAGTGQKGYAGDGGPATDALLNQPYEVRFDRSGNLYFVEMPNHVVRKVDRATRLIGTIAGTGVAGFYGDGGPATQAQFKQPHSIAFDGEDGLLICDIGNHRIRLVNLKNGIIDTFAGTGERKPTPDGSSLAGTPLDGPRAVAFDELGNLYIVLREGNAVYRVDGTSRKIFRFAGTGEKGYSGDGAAALNAKFNGPKGIACARDGSVYIADTENHTIRRIDKQGIITTVLGTGERGNGPDGDPLKCKLSRPHGVFAGRDGTVYVADSESNRIRVLR